jgi:hypothetical protein
MERAMGESIAEGPAMMQVTTQDEEVSESKRDKSVGEEEPEAAAKAVESSTISKRKWKVVPVRAKVFSEVDGPVSDSTEVVVNIQLTHHAHSATGVSLRRRSCRASPRHMRGKSREVVECEVVITSKRSRGQLVPQADESLTGDDVELLEAPRGESYHLCFICS